LRSRRARPVQAHPLPGQHALASRSPLRQRRLSRARPWG